MDFKKALQLLKEGKSLRRASWDENQFVVLQPAYPEGIMPNENTQKAWNLEKDELFKCNPYFQIKEKDGSHSMYQFNQTDILANDWSII